jgi:L-alanine-DL-glutamate epimerase-like enolase superfamily enzyme
MTGKETFFIRIFDDCNPTVLGLGECAVFRGLSVDDVPEYENTLADICWNIEEYKEIFREKFNLFPSIICGFEMAFADLENGGIRQPFPSRFTQREGFIRINGLIWMGTKENMRQQIIEKIENGFSCIKLKIGAIHFEEELELLKQIRKEFSRHEIELRVDANGAFTPEEALTKLEQLAKLDLHSIEQPIKAGKLDIMSGLCRKTPLPIALDEELTGYVTKEEKRRLLEEVRPQYIVLKPSLHGGFCGSQEWIDLASEFGTGWWITSALESNVGLNAIAQWTYRLNNPLPQGLGTGQLYLNNVPPEPDLQADKLFFRGEENWEHENEF